jgi:hypothetical protein
MELFYGNLIASFSEFHDPVATVFIENNRCNLIYLTRLLLNI